MYIYTSSNVHLVLQTSTPKFLLFLMPNYTGHSCILIEILLVPDK